MKKSFLYPIAFMGILTMIFVSILAFLNENTIEKINLNQEIDLRKKILYVFDINYDENDLEEMNRLFEDHIEEIKVDDENLYLARDNDGNELGYAYPVGGPGLWGQIKAYVGISTDGSELLGLEFIAQDETPGLGGRIDEKVFKEQFRQISLEGEGPFIVYNPAPNGSLDAIAGATLTSQAVADFLNKDLKVIREGL